MRVLFLQTAFLISLYSASSASILMDGPVSLYSQSTLHETPGIPASIVYEHDETLFVLRGDQFPIKVLILSGTAGANCSIPMGSMQEVYAIGEGENVSPEGFYSLTLSPDAIYILVHDNNERRVKLQAYSMETFQKLFEKDLSDSGFHFGTEVKHVDNSLLFYGSSPSTDAYMERRTLAGDIDWSIDVAFQNSLSRFTDAMHFGADYVATGYTVDRDPTTGILSNKQVFVCRIDSSNGDVSFIQYMTGEADPFFPPFLVGSPSCSHFGVVYDAATADNIFDVRLALYNDNMALVATHDMLDEPLEVYMPTMGGKGTARIGTSGIAVALGLAESTYLAYFDCDDAETALDVTPISMQFPITGNLNLNPIPNGAVFSMDNIVDPEVRANFIMICPE